MIGTVPPVTPPCSPGPMIVNPLFLEVEARGWPLLRPRVRWVCHRPVCGAAVHQGSVPRRALRRYRQIGVRVSRSPRDEDRRALAGQVGRR